MDDNVSANCLSSLPAFQFIKSSLQTSSFVCCSLSLHTVCVSCSHSKDFYLMSLAGIMEGRGRWTRGEGGIFFYVKECTRETDIPCRASQMWWQKELLVQLRCFIGRSVLFLPSVKLGQNKNHLYLSNTFSFIITEFLLGDLGIIFRPVWWGQECACSLIFAEY